jgi:hypothetical protein
MHMFFAAVATSGRSPEALATSELSPADLTNIEINLQELEQIYRHLLQESRDRLNEPKYAALKANIQQSLQKTDRARQFINQEQEKAAAGQCVDASQQPAAAGGSGAGGGGARSRRKFVDVSPAINAILAASSHVTASPAASTSSTACTSSDSGRVVPLGEFLASCDYLQKLPPEVLDGIFVPVPSELEVYLERAKRARTEGASQSRGTRSPKGVSRKSAELFQRHEKNIVLKEVLEDLHVWAVEQVADVSLSQAVDNLFITQTFAPPREECVVFPLVAVRVLQVRYCLFNSMY